MKNFGEIHKLIPLCDDIIKLKHIVLYVNSEHWVYFQIRMA